MIAVEFMGGLYIADVCESVRSALSTVVCEHRGWRCSDPSHRNRAPVRRPLTSGGATLVAMMQTCRAQNLEPQCFRLTKGDGRLLLPEQDGGGMGASVVWMGDRGLFQI
jgi:hypothetical protein